MYLSLLCRPILCSNFANIQLRFIMFCKLLIAYYYYSYTYFSFHWILVRSTVVSYWSVHIIRPTMTILQLFLFYHSWPQNDGQSVQSDRIYVGHDRVENCWILTVENHFFQRHYKYHERFFTTCTLCVSACR